MKNLKIFLFILLAFFVANVVSVSATDVVVPTTITVVDPLYTVSTSIGSNGTVAPTSRTGIASGTSVTFTVTPNANYSAVVIGCGGTLSGTTYTTAPITSNCNVSATFYSNTCFITFNGNGNTGGSMSPEQFTTNEAKNLTTNGFTKTGYTFGGWATSASGSAIYANQGLYTMGSTCTPATLYAKWNLIGTPPSISSPTQSNVACSTATLGATVTSAGTSAVTSRGVCYKSYGTASYYPLDGTCVAASTAGTGAFTVNVTGLSPSVPYSFVGYASNASGPSQTSPAVSFSTTSCPPPPPVPSVFSTSACYAAAPGSLTISWPAVSGATRYEIYEGANTIYNGSVTSYIANGLVLGSTHIYTVKAFNAAGLSGGASASVSGTVGGLCASGINLVASAPTPNTAIVGIPQTFSSTITNNGTVGTGAGFSNFFQVCSTASQSGVCPPTSTITDKPSSSMLALSASGTRVTTVSHTFASAGTYSIQACADKSSSSSTGAITESNEGDNCSGWTNVTVSPSGICTVTADTNYNIGPCSGICKNNNINYPACDVAVQTDLTVGNTNPLTANTGVSTSFTATAYNTGSNATGLFDNIFQVANTYDSSTGQVTGLNTYKLPTKISISGNYHGILVYSHTFSSSGNYYVRFCTDKSSESDVNGVIAESDENNNCWDWEKVTVSGMAAPDLVTSFSLPSTIVQQPTPSYYPVTVTNNSSYSTGSVDISVTTYYSNYDDINGATLAYRDDTAINGIGGTFSRTATAAFPLTTLGQRYFWACADKPIGYGSQGAITETNENNNCSQQIVNVVNTMTLPTVSVTATYNGQAVPGAKASVPYNSTVKVGWNATDATSCSGASLPTGFSGSGTNTLSSPITSQSLKKDTIFTITCTGPGGTGSGTVTVPVDPINAGYIEI